MKRISAALLLFLAARASAGMWGGAEAPSRTKEEDEAFNSSAQLFQETGRDKLAAVQAFENFLAQFPNSQRTPDAQFMIGDAYMQHALSILKAESSSKKNSSARLLAPKNPAAVAALENAKKVFEQVADRKNKSGLAPSAQYRLGEVLYNQKEWSRAVDEFKQVEKEFSKSYIVPESMMGIVYAYLALEQFSQAESELFLLGETYPSYLKEPAVLYAQGIVSLHKGDYANAEKALKRVKTPEAQFYLGKTFLLSRRAFLAAAAFENLIRDYPDSDLKEEAQFFIGDSFFLAEDYAGAISKYQRFISLYPESPLRVSALFRIGSSYFQKKDYVEARANFQAVLDRYPKDFFAPLAQYFIAESHLIADQVREALFDYTKVITQYPETVKISPLAHFKLAWTQLQVGDYAQAIQTCNNFLALYPTNALAKNVYLIMGNSMIHLKRHTEAVAAFQRIIDLAPSSDIAEQALFSILQNQFNLKAYNSILTSYQFIFRHLPPSKSKWRSLSYLYAAEAYLALNQVDEAKTIYEMVRKVYPDDPAAFYAQDGLAWCYSYKGEDQKALEERQKLKDMMATATSTFTFTGLNELGIAESMFNQKNYDDAYQLYDKFARENPKAPEAASALYHAAESLYHLKYYTQAIETWRRLQVGYPQAKETQLAVFQTADTLFRAQKYGEAIEAYKGIIANYPQSPQLPLAFLRIAQSAFNSNDDQGTIRQAQELIARFPKAPEAGDALDLMEGVFDRNKTIEFKATLRALIAANQTNPIGGEAQFRLARRCFEAKDFASAAVEFQKFSVDYTDHPQLSKAQFFLGESYFNQNNFAGAAPAFERLLTNFEKSDDTPLALFHLASAYYSLKKYEEAIRSYTRLVEEFPQAEYAKATEFNLALCYKALGKLDMAQYAYQKYVASSGAGDQGAASALWEIFSIQKDRKDYDAAIATLEQIRDQAKPESDAPVEATYRMGEVYQAMGRPDESMRALEKLRGMKPANSQFRLQGLIKLGEAYEKAQDFERAAAVYDDLARNASKEVASSAAQRAAGLRKMHKAGAVSAPDSGGDTVIGAPPAESAPAPEPAKKPGKNKKAEKASKAKELPGMGENIQ